MIPRALASVLHSRALAYPIVTVTGPRQSGKTTLCRGAFPDKPYVSLERPDVQRDALHDPLGFLARYPEGAILDEVQRAPEIFSYLQVEVDETRRNGRWILTGSQDFALLEKVTQSLAGRTAILRLLPLSLAESRVVAEPRDVHAEIFRGGYPRLRAGDLGEEAWFPDYVTTYVERDVRSILGVTDLSAFQTFLRMCAGRTGQLLNLSALGADCGISHSTAREWLSVLEASYVAFRLQPLHLNVTKRLTKSPKLYFHDTGLACYLLGIRSVEDLLYHPLRGALFETWVVTEVLKWRWNRGLPADLAFYREATGVEIDLVIERGREPIGIEIKASRTAPPVPSSAFDALQKSLGTGPAQARKVKRCIVHAGDESKRVADVDFVPWRELGSRDWGAS